MPGLDDVGLSRFYRAVSIGRDPSLPDAVSFTNEAASLKSCAPVHIRGSRNGAEDLTVTWVRRTRPAVWPPSGMAADTEQPGQGCERTGRAGRTIIA